MNTFDQIEIIKLAEKLIYKALAEGAYLDMVLPGTPYACLNMLDKLQIALQASNEVQNVPVIYEIDCNL